MAAYLLIPQLFAYSLVTVIVIDTASFGWAADCGQQSTGVRRLITVDQNGKGQFKTVQSAIDSIPEENHDWVEIQINPGLYIEQVSIPYNKECVFLNGSGRSITIISYDAHSSTDKSATFTSTPANVVVSGITFKNTYNRYWPSIAKEGDRVIQALAVRVYGDKSVFYSCGFESVQDTVWDVQGRHYFYNCYIEGAVDFIFGDGQSYYENCIINATVGVKPLDLPVGYVTAQGRQSENDPSGFIFKGGQVFAGKDTYLGRAYGPYARVIFDGTTLPDGLNPQGWDAWHYVGKEWNFFFGEVNCLGPGANVSGRVPWKRNIRESDLQQYSISSFIDKEGWLGNQPLAGWFNRHPNPCPVSL